MIFRGHSLVNGSVVIMPDKTVERVSSILNTAEFGVVVTLGTADEDVWNCSPSDLEYKLGAWHLVRF